MIIDELGFAPLDLAGTQLLFRFVAAAYERRSLGIASHWPFDAWGRFLPEHTTAASMLDRLLHHAVVVVTCVVSQYPSVRYVRQRQQVSTAIVKSPLVASESPRLLACGSSRLRRRGLAEQPSRHF